jgi:homoserine kinase type II
VKTSQGQFVLTICDEKNYTEVKNLTNLLILLEQKNFPTTSMVFSKTRELITCYRNKSVILKKYIEGRVFLELDLNMLFQLGQNLARLHEIDAPKYLPKSFPYGVDFFNEIISSQVNPAYSNWLKEKQELIITSLSADLPRGIIHGDIFYDNVLFSPSKQLAAIIDFEEACFYYKIFDLGMCIVGTCAPHGKLSLAKAKSLVDGYQTKRTLEGLEKESLKVFAEYAAIATSFWRFRQHHIIKPNENKASSFLEMWSLADTIQSLSADEFVKKIFKNH